MSATAQCPQCGITMLWTPGGYGDPAAHGGRCSGCWSTFTQAIGRSFDALASSYRLDHQVATLRALLAQGGISHSRSRYHAIHVYRYDSASPSGFMLAGSFDDRPEITNLLRGGLSPLSPTEAR